MINDQKGFITIKYGESIAMLNFLNRGDHLIGITLDDSKKIEMMNEITQAAEGIKGTEFFDIQMEVLNDKELGRAIYDEMTELGHNHFKEYDERLVPVKVIVK